MTENEIIKYIEQHEFISDEVKDMAINAIKENQQYHAIGTVEELQALKEKAEPKKPFQPFGTHSYKCSNCWKFVAHEVDDNCDLEATMADYCPYCGQKLDWS